MGTNMPVTRSPLTTVATHTHTHIHGGEPFPSMCMSHTHTTYLLLLRMNGSQWATCHRGRSRECKYTACDIGPHSDVGEVENFQVRPNTWLPWKRIYCSCSDYYYFYLFIIIYCLFFFSCSLTSNLTPWTCTKTHQIWHNNQKCEKFYLHIGFVDVGKEMWPQRPLEKWKYKSQWQPVQQSLSYSYKNRYTCSSWGDEQKILLWPRP